MQTFDYRTVLLPGGRSPDNLSCWSLGERFKVKRTLAVVVLAVAPLAAQGAQSDREALRKAVEQLLSQPPLSNARVALQVESLDDGQVIYSRNPDDLLNPASNTKLVTAAAGLLRLGPEYRFITDYLADKPMAHGRIGTLYVKGRGDPSVTTERLDGLVSDLWHRGVRTIGAIVLDDSLFDREEYGPGWEQEPSDKAWAAGVGALSVNHNAGAIYITPADRVGARASVEVEPDARDYFVIDNRVVTVRANGRRKLRPRTVAEGERTRIVVDGRIPLRADSMMMYRRVGDPAFYYGHTLRMLLRQRGIRVSGRVKRGAIPQAAVLIQSYESPELAEIIHDMNKASSNFIAEMLVKTLGAELKGMPGSWPKGLEVAEDLLAELGIPRGTYVLKNGSGLNDTNRFTARQIATLLQAVWKRFPVASEFVSSLGIAAGDKKNLPFLRSALRSERDPLLRIVLADAVYRSDPDQGGGMLLEAMPASADLFLRLRSVGRELALPVPAVSSLLDLAVDGSAEALARLFALAPLARGAQRDEQLAAMLSDGLVEVGDASPDEMFAALRVAPAPQAQAAIELVAAGVEQTGTDAAR